MQNKTVKLFALGALAAATTFGASAENTYDYFVGFDAGTHVSGNANTKWEDSAHPDDNIDEDTDTKASAIVGLSGGVIINDHHRVKLGLAYDAFETDVDDTIDRTDLTASYDYMLPIANKLNWTVGAHMGYEFFESTDGAISADELDGLTYGIQTGLDYRLTKNWSLGAEVAYTVHDGEFEEQVTENGKFSYQIEDDVTVMANVQYHF